jgi:hypothetical protein
VRDRARSDGKWGQCRYTADNEYAGQRPSWKTPGSSESCSCLPCNQAIGFQLSSRAPYLASSEAVTSSSARLIEPGRSRFVAVTASDCDVGRVGTASTGVIGDPLMPIALRGRAATASTSTSWPASRASSPNRSSLVPPEDCLHSCVGQIRTSLTRHQWVVRPRRSSPTRQGSSG